MRRYPGLDPEDEAKLSRIVIADIETTGFVVGEAEVIHAAMICCDYQTLAPLGAKLFKIRPRFPKGWRQDAEKIHGISFEEAIGFPDAASVTKEMGGWLQGMTEGQPSAFACHATKPFFDWRHLRQLFWDMGSEGHFVEGHLFWERIFPNKLIQSTVVWSRDLQKQNLIGGEDSNLAGLCSRLDIALDHHSAISDAKACGELIIKFRSL